MSFEGLNPHVGLYTVGGYLPHSDASGYFINSLKLIESGTLNEWGLSIRSAIIYSLSSLLQLANKNLKITLVMLSWIASFGIFTLYRFIKTVFTPLLGVLIIYICIYQYRVYSGLYSGENLGYSISLLSATGLLGYLTSVSFFKRNLYAVLCIFFLSIAFQIRAGTIFIVPFLILYFGATIDVLWKNRLKLVVGLVTIFVSVSLIIPSLNKLSNPDATVTVQGNFSMVLYAMSKGLPPSRWSTALTDNPKLLHLKPSQRFNRYYEIAIDNIRKEPLLITSFILNNIYKNIFNLNMLNEVVRGLPLIIKKGTNFLFFISILLIPLLVYKKKYKIIFLVSALLAGYILSDPFIFGQYRTLAASKIFITLIPILIIGILIKKNPDTEDEKLNIFNVLLFLGLVIFIVGLMPVVNIIANKDKLSFLKNIRPCQQGNTVFFRMDNNYMVLDDDYHHDLNYVNIDLFKKDHPSRPNKKVKESYFYTLPKGKVIHHIYPMNLDERIYLVTDDLTNYRVGSIAKVCATSVGKVVTSKGRVYKGYISEIIE